jgi:hypothetical protein
MAKLIWSRKGYLVSNKTLLYMKTIFLLFLIIVLSSCSSSHQDRSKQKHSESESNQQNLGNHVSESTFVHTVFFWMKEDLSAEEAKFFEEGMDELGRIPSILSYKWGKPAGTPRDVVDNSYTYAWIGEFASPEDQDAYQIDPLHKKFVEEAKDLWTKIQVYDTILE